MRLRAINFFWRSLSSELNIWLSESVKVCLVIFLFVISFYIDSFLRVVVLFVLR